jgi:hypothetical protein
MNVEVTLIPRAGTTITKVDPGRYQVTDYEDGSSTIDFGELARKEDRKIIIEIELPAVRRNEPPRTVMTVECTYRYVYWLLHPSVAEITRFPPGDTLSETEGVERITAALLHTTN